MIRKKHRKVNLKRPRLLLPLALWLVGVLSPGFLYWLRTPRETQAVWWPGGGAWAKRQQLKVVNSASATLHTNTPIAITIDTKTLADQNLIKDDCSDLRIIYQPNETTHTELARSLVFPGGSSCTSSTATKVYFNLQTDLTTIATTTDYYAYYGNPQADTPTNTDDAFDMGSAQALLVCPFEGSTTCAAGETPSTESGAIRYSQGKSALSFDGNSDYVTHNDIVGATFPYTAEAWVYFYTVPGDDRAIFGTQNSGIKWDGAWSRFVFRQGASSLSCYSPPVANTWYHVAGVADADGNLQFYLNGTSCGSSVVGTSLTWAGYIGSSYATQKFFNGKIDEVRISNIARYTSNFTPQTTPFVRDEYTKLLLHFDENGDDPRNTGKAIDDSGNGNHGTITGAKYVGGLVGIDPSASSGRVASQSYASHDGIFIEEGTTNKITNPSFEHETFNTGWTGETDDTTFNLATASATFTPSMAKRNSAGPFAAGVISQTDYADSVTGDLINFSSGSKIGPTNIFFEHIDMRQMSIVFWITPEWDGNDNKIHYILYPGVNNSSRYPRIHKSADNTLCFYTRDTTSSIDISDWQAGQTYNVVIRWDNDNPFYVSGGTQHRTIFSINGVSTTTNGGSGANYAASSIDYYIGGSSAYPGGPNAIIEGLTIYRRPLYDGTYGIDVGNGDEISQIYGGGTSPKDPTLITGSWDVVFALPTNASTGALTTGTGNAWSHPHASNLLYTDTTNTGGFMMNGTYTNDGWAGFGAYTDISALAADEKIYAGGYKVTGNTGAALRYTKDVVAGGDYVIRAVAHSDGSCVPTVRIWDNNTATLITSLAGTNTSTRTDPDVMLFTWEAPAGNNSDIIELYSDASVGDTCYWHQVEVLPNLIATPSFETGSGSWCPLGWECLFDSGDTEKDLVDYHSGSASLHTLFQIWGSHRLWTPHFSLTTGNFYNFGGWTKADGGTNIISGIGLDYYFQNTSSTSASFSYAGVADWTHKSLVGRAGADGYGQFQFQTTPDGSGLRIDDFYLVSLANVSLTVTPASLANSTESTGVRVDGLDTFTQPITNLTATSGAIRFKYTPRHSDSNMAQFGYINSPDWHRPTIFHFYSVNPDNVSLYWTANNTLALSLNSEGGSEIGSWTPSGEIIAGTTYDMEVSYTSDQMVLKVDGVTKITINHAVNFANLPVTMRWGHTSNSDRQADATFSNPGLTTLTENSTAPYVKFGSKSAKLVESSGLATKYTTEVNPGNTNTHTLSAYVYDGTSGNVGGTVSSSIAKLVFDGVTVTPSAYTDMGGGWWRLTYSAAVTNASKAYGVEVQAGKTIYLDGVQLEEKAYATTYTDGSLGTGYAWTGTENESTSTRTAASDYYSAGDNINSELGTISVWVKPNWSSSQASTLGYPSIFTVNSVGNCVTSGTMDIVYQGGSFKLIPSSCSFYEGPYVAKSFNAGDWIHVVAAWNFITDQHSIYINNVSNTVNLSKDAPSISSLYVGNGFGLSRRFDGVISDLRIYDTALDSTQVADLYYAGLASHQDTTGTVEVDRFDEEKGQDPMAVWHFNEGYGTQVGDSSPYLNHLTISGATWTVIPNYTALQLDGTDDYLYRNMDTDFDFGSEPFSISGMFRHPSTISGTDTILARQNGSVGYKVYMNSTGYLCFSVNSDSACTTTSYVDSKWHHFEAVRGSTTLTIYIDGEQAAQATGLTATTVNGNNKLYLGIDSDGTSNPWTGFLDEIAIYPYARDSSQVLTDNLGQQISVLIGARAEDNLADGLVGHWKMDEASWNGTANEVVDSSGNGNHGTAVNGATTASGKFGNGGSFDGGTKYVNIGDKPDFDFGNRDFTVSAWAYRNSGFESWDYIVLAKHNTGGLPDTNEWSLSHGSSATESKPNFNIYSGSTSYVITSPDTTEDNRWYHLVGIRHGEYTYLYVNGELKGSQHIGNVTVNNVSGRTLKIAKIDAGLYGLDGYADDARVYNRALSPAEVEQLYNWAPGPVAHWSFDDGAGTSAQDSSGNGNTGTLTNGPTWTNGKFGKGLSFAATQKVTATVSQPNGSASVFTFEGWLKPNTYGNQNTVVWKTNPTLTFKLVPRGSSSYFTVYSSASGVVNSNYFSYTVGDWIHCVFQFNSDTGGYAFYKNGALITSGTSTFGAINSATSTYTVGHWTDGEGMRGIIDDIRIYNYARTQKQIVQDMNAGHPAVGSPVGSPVAYYKFDEGQGITANNAGNGGSSLNGTLTNMASPATATSGWASNGKFSKGLNFDGSNDYVNLGTSSTLNPSQMTMSAWVYFDTFPTSHNTARVVIRRDSSYILYLYKSDTYWGGEAQLVLGLPTLIANYSDSPHYAVSNLSTGTWYQVLGTYDGVFARLYVNGKEVSNYAVSGSIASTANQTRIGADSAGTADYFMDGMIDQVKIYNYALSPEEVKLEYNQGAAMVVGSTGTASNGILADNSASREYCVPGDTSTCNPPVAEWKFDEGSGTSTYDTSGNNNTGTLTNGPTWTNGKYGKAIRFDGVNDYMSMANSTLNKSIWTFSTWFNWNGAACDGGYCGIASQVAGAASNGSRILLSSSTGKILVQGVCCGLDLLSNTVFTANQWYYIALTQTGGTVNLYVNGVYDNTGSGTFSSSTNPMIIGRGASSSYYFKGILDGTKFYDYARTQKQIAWEYNRGGPIGWWKLDECEGLVAHDASGQGNDGTITIGAGGTNSSAGTCGGSTGQAWYDGREGKYSGSLEFDGTDDYINLGDIGDLDQELTLAAWVKFEDVDGAFQTIIAKRNGSNTTTNWAFRKAWSGFWGENDELDFYHYNGGWKIWQTTNANLSSNNWYLLTVSYDGSTDPKIYMNGELLSGHWHSTYTGPSGMLTNNYNASIGALTSVSERLSGQIDDVRIYNYVLTSEQVKILYNENAAVRWGE